MALVGLHGAWNYSAETARSAVARPPQHAPFAVCRTYIVLVELLIRVVDGALADIEANDKIFPHDPGIPLSGVDGFELAVDVDFLQLVDQDHRSIAIRRNVARRHRDSEPFVRP